MGLDFNRDALQSCRSVAEGGREGVAVSPIRTRVGSGLVFAEKPLLDERRCNEPGAAAKAAAVKNGPLHAIEGPHKVGTAERFHDTASTRLDQPQFPNC